jgi:citrate synthase
VYINHLQFTIHHSQFTINKEFTPMTTSPPPPIYRPGLEGVIAAETALSHPNGQAGRLTIAGYAVEELAATATSEEVAYLLWHGRLPTPDELTRFKHELAAHRALPEATLNLLRAAARRAVPAMDALRMAIASLDLDLAPEQLEIGLVARTPTIIAAYGRLLQGQEPLPPRPDLDHAANYLYMLHGEPPVPAQVRGLETYLNTVSDHGLNASTFTARIIVSTDSDVVSAVTGAIGALKGPKHGGAPGPALDMVFEIGTAERAESYLQAKLDKGERLMGFGHRVYKVRDPRAVVLSQAAADMYRAGGNMALYQLAQQVEETAVRLLAEYKPGRNLQTNVEFYTALLLHGLGLPSDLFTPTFALGRMAGWIAHCREQQASNRLIRPLSRYTGPTNQRIA